MTKFKAVLLILLICYFSTCSTLEYSRDLRAGGGRGGGRSSGRSRSFKKTYTIKKITYSTTKNTRVYKNTYFDGTATYRPLYVYYHPVGLYFAAGYYSYLYS